MRPKPRPPAEDNQGESKVAAKAASTCAPAPGKFAQLRVDVQAYAGGLRARISPSNRGLRAQIGALWGAMSKTKIMLIRHGEKHGHGIQDRGVSADGAANT